MEHSIEITGLPEEDKDLSHHPQNLICGDRQTQITQENEEMQDLSHQGEEDFSPTDHLKNITIIEIIALSTINTLITGTEAPPEHQQEMLQLRQDILLLTEMKTQC